MSSRPRPLVALLVGATAALGVLSAAPASAAPLPLAGSVVVLDPGHNALNGRLDPKCNTTGTSTDAGYREHAHTWDVANRTAARLRALGARVYLTRADDRSAGPCTTARAALADRVKADVLVSVHDDGAPAQLRGYHVIWSDLPAQSAAQRDSSRRLALALRTSIGAGTGLPRASYVLRGAGIQPRRDLVTLNATARPAALVEIGNMRNAADARLLSTPAFREREAASLVSGIRAYLRR